jgi:hypothetical protein
MFYGRFMKKYTLIFGLIISLISCVNKTNEKAIVSFSSDELNIINQIMKTINLGNKIVIINENIEVTYTTQDNNRNNIYKYLKRTKSVDNDLLNSFKKNNHQQMILDKSIVFDFNFMWNEIPEHNNDTINYYGIIAFSKIGFNEEQTKAIIYVGIMMEGDGRGNYYILEKENNQWKIKNIIGGWIT